jgi:hypothetical protein
MRLNNFKGALLEFLIRKLLRSCGFTAVTSDGIYTYEQSGLFFIHGKGAAHDADVLMEPPIQMPFSYPSRILFECKALSRKTGLGIIRNALGLRYDINEFEIVTKATLSSRQNNRRANYAIEDRNRYNYQVGVASVNGFTKPAIEFAANNKIPLLSLNWFLDRNILDGFNSINQSIVDRINGSTRDRIHKFLKDRNADSETAHFHLEARSSLFDIPEIQQTINEIDRITENSFFAINEAGDFFFLYPAPDFNLDYFREIRRLTGLKARIHYSRDEKNIWLLSISQDFSSNNNADFKFFVPERIMSIWERFSFDKTKALDIKNQFYSRIFIFDIHRERELPFIGVTIDRPWLQRGYEES